MRLSMVDAAYKAKDLFLFTAIILAAVFFGVKKLPALESIVLGSMFTVGTLTVIDFFKIGAIYQTIAFASGIVLLGCFLNLKNNDFKYLERFFVFTGVLIVLHMVLCNFGFRVPEYTGKLIAWMRGITIEVKSNWGGETFPLGPLLNPGHDGAYLALIVPFLLNRKFLVVVPAVIAGLYLQGSLAAWLTAICAVLYWGWIKTFPHRKMAPYYVAIVGMLLLPLLFHYFEFRGDSGRFVIWKLGTSLTSWKTFFVGNGFGWFYDTFHKYFIISISETQKGWARQEHNEFLALYFSFGAILTTIFLGMVRKRVCESRNITAMCGMFALFINSYANFGFHISPIAALGIFYYAYLLKGEKDDETLESKTSY